MYYEDYNGEQLLKYLNFECQLCENQVDIFFKITNDMITVKYFEAFNFYMAKSINEILANIQVPNAILFKDLTFNDSDREYLKQYHSQNDARMKIDEIFTVLTNTTMFKPNLSSVSSADIILKRYKKLKKLDLRKNDKYEFLEQKEKKQMLAEKIRKLIDENESHERLLPSSILRNNKNNNSSLYKLKQQLNYQENDKSQCGHQILNQFKDSYDSKTYNNLMQMFTTINMNLYSKISFETFFHDIYKGNESDSGNIQEKGQKEVKQIEKDKCLPKCSLNKQKNCTEKCKQEEKQQVPGGYKKPSSKICKQQQDWKQYLKQNTNVLFSKKECAQNTLNQVQKSQTVSTTQDSRKNVDLLKDNLKWHIQKQNQLKEMQTSGKLKSNLRSNHFDHEKQLQTLVKLVTKTNLSPQKRSSQSQPKNRKSPSLQQQHSLSSKREVPVLMKPKNCQLTTNKIKQKQITSQVHTQSSANSSQQKTKKIRINTQESKKNYKITLKGLPQYLTKKKRDLRITALDLASGFLKQENSGIEQSSKYFSYIPITERTKVQQSKLCSQQTKTQNNSNFKQTIRKARDQIENNQESITILYGFENEKPKKSTRSNQINSCRSSLSNTPHEKKKFKFIEQTINKQLMKKQQPSMLLKQQINQKDIQLEHNHYKFN